MFAFERADICMADSNANDFGLESITRISSFSNVIFLGTKETVES